MLLINMVYLLTNGFTPKQSVDGRQVVRTHETCIYLKALFYVAYSHK
ncbi:hypothetical protein PS900_02075 [Pseudomonas fluorescens]|uniref:Uncharacterized protein n=1 Tax=Pseudomonas fluorescens TaxID=294 RepID=A0A8H2NQH7_PSEFL|nr:hypothetical protein PS900_02075 [Pseudomonas fluorescens]